MAIEFGMMDQTSPCCMPSGALQTIFLSQLPIPGQQRFLPPSHHVHPNGTCIPGHSIFRLARFACLPVQHNWADLMTSNMGWHVKSAANHDISEVYSGTTIAPWILCSVGRFFPVRLHFSSLPQEPSSPIFVSPSSLILMPPRMEQE